MRPPTAASATDFAATPERYFRQHTRGAFTLMAGDADAYCALLLAAAPRRYFAYAVTAVIYHAAVYADAFMLFINPYFHAAISFRFSFAVRERQRRAPPQATSADMLLRARHRHAMPYFTYAIDTVPPPMSSLRLRFHCFFFFSLLLICHAHAPPTAASAL